MIEEPEWVPEVGERVRVCVCYWKSSPFGVVKKVARCGVGARGVRVLVRLDDGVEVTGGAEYWFFGLELKPLSVIDHLGGLV